MDLDINVISKQYSEKNILVIGDIILDAYIYGKVDRISEEAPVPIVAINNKNFNSTIKKLETRDICIFPSSLFHKTIPFESKEERICFVFDLAQKI